MGSATWVCISAAVAPGQIAETFTTLTVKKGSSARPSRSYEKKPAAPSATTRNRISAGWLTAQPERLKCFIAPLQSLQKDRHCERSEAIHRAQRKCGLLRRFAPRNDGLKRQ